MRTSFTIIIVHTLCLLIPWRSLAQETSPSVDELLSEGRNAYSEELDFEGALRIYENITQHPEATDHQLLEALEYVAACRFALGDQEGARLALLEMLSISFVHNLNDPSHSPDLLQLLEDVRSEMDPPTVETEQMATQVSPEVDDVDPPGTPVFGAVENTELRQRPRRPWYRTWWFWTLTGVVIAGAVTIGVVVGTREDEVLDPPRGSLDPGVVQLPCTIRF